MHNSVWGYLLAIALGGMSQFAKDQFPDWPSLGPVLFWLAFGIGVIATVGLLYEIGWIQKGFAYLRQYRLRVPWERKDARGPLVATGVTLAATATVRDISPEERTLRRQIETKDREIADLRAAKNKDPELEKLRRITESIALTERRRALVSFQERLPQLVKEADGFFHKIVNRQPSRQPDETPSFYHRRLETIREGYLSLVGKDVPELDSDRFYEANQIVAVDGETPDMPDIARTERRRKYARHNSFMDGARVISMRIPFALEKLDKQLAELQREANEYMRIRNKKQT